MQLMFLLFSGLGGEEEMFMLSYEIFMRPLLEAKL